MDGKIASRLADRDATWLVTGCAGFIGSNLLEALLRLDFRLQVGIVDLSGHPSRGRAIGVLAAEDTAAKDV